MLPHLPRTDRSMRRLPLFKQAAVRFLYIKDRYKCIRVNFYDSIAQLHDFQTGNNAIKDPRPLPRIRAFTVESGNAAMHIPRDTARHLFILRRNDEYPLHFVKTVRHDIDDLIGDKVGNKGIHGAVPGENEA